MRLPVRSDDRTFTQADLAGGVREVRADVVADAAGAFDHDPEEVSQRVVVFGASPRLERLGIEPAKAHATVRAGGEKGDPSGSFELVVECEALGTIGVECRFVVAPDDSTNFTRLSASMVRTAESEIVKRSNRAICELDMIPDADP